MFRLFCYAVLIAAIKKDCRLMSDIDSEDDLKNFEPDPEDLIRPIQIDSGGAQPAMDDVLPSLPEERGPEDAPARTGLKHAFDGEFNLLNKGDYIDLREKDPTLNRIVIGAGWEQRSMEEDKIDIDLSCFLLDREEMTRVDEDFVFYNNEKALDGAVKHQGDSRTGAGEGDDESIFIDLNGIPFDVLKVVFVLSVYQEEEQSKTFGMVRDLYVRIVNEDDENELLRLIPPEDEIRGANAMQAFCLVREGPKWFAEALGVTTKSRLNEFVRKYGLTIREETG